MPLTYDPAVIESSAGAPAYSAQEARLGHITPLIAGAGNAIQARSGVRITGAANDLKVEAQTTPDMTVKVNLGQALIQGTAVTAQGAYGVTNEAIKNLAISAAHATLSRKDRVVIRIRDHAHDALTFRDGDIIVITGTPASSPSPPANPDIATYFDLAEVLVDPAVTTIVNGKITDKRVFTAALGGMIPCTSGTIPASPAAGQPIWETDTGRGYVRDGSIWRELLTSKHGKNLIDCEFHTAGDISAGIVAEFTALTTTVTVEPNRVYRIEVSLPTHQNDGVTGQAGSHARMRIKSGATTKQETGFVAMPASGFPLVLKGSVTYVTGGAETSLTVNVTIERALGAGSFKVFGTSTEPAEIAIMDVSGNTGLVHG